MRVTEATPGSSAGRDVLDAARLPVPVVDAADEGRDERDAGLGAGHGLREAEQQRQVAVDAVALEALGSADALPGARDLDEHAVARDAGGFVELDQPARLDLGRLGVEAEPRVHLRRDAPGDQLQDAAAEAHEQVVDDLAEAGVRVSARRRRRDGLVDDRPVARILGRLEDQARVGRRVLRLEAGDGLDVAGVRDDHRVPLQAVELAAHSDHVQLRMSSRSMPCSWA